MAAKYTFQPDYTVPPGATLKETLDAKGLSQADLSLRTGLSEKTISQIVNGIAPISFDTAEKLELATGIPASFWNRRELSYREALARTEEIKRLQADVAWLKEVPVKVLVEHKKKYVEPTAGKADMARRVLKFFGVSSVEAWRKTWLRPAAQYRGREVQHKYPGYAAAWRRMGELEAERTDCAPFDARVFRRVLATIRHLTRESADVWYPRVVEECASAGVAVTFVKEIPRAAISGLTKWLTKDKALLMLSLKYKSDDQLWFSFFHEAGHILLHGKRDVFLESGWDDSTNEEKEANAFARDLLIPPEFTHRFPHLKSKAAIRRFAREIDVAVGVVVGRLQHDGFLPRSHCNDLKVKLDWADTA